MYRIGILLLVLPVFLISLAGCAATGTNQGLETQSLRNQITVLEAQLKVKDDEIESLKNTGTGEAAAQVQVKQETERQQVITKQECSYPKDKAPVKVRKIQSALKKAGFDPGKIDGQMGKDTREAIKGFQKANNLEVTGKVDQQTWKLLKPCLKKGK